LVARPNLPSNRPIFKAPPLSVRTPTTESVQFLAEIRDKNRAKQAGG
jgi:hypothetical protein